MHNLSTRGLVGIQTASGHDPNLSPWRVHVNALLCRDAARSIVPLCRCAGQLKLARRVVDQRT
jgi:hypothetical protein